MERSSRQEEGQGKETIAEMARVLGPELAWRSGRVGLACGE